MDIIGFLYGFGLLHGILLAGALLVLPSGNRLANGFMAGLVLAMALNLLQYWLIRTDYFIENPSLARLIPPLDFTWGPLLYLYAYSLTNRSISWAQSLHLLPAVFFFSSSIHYMTLPESSQSELLAFLWSQRTTPLIPDTADAIPVFWRMWIDLHLPGTLFAVQFAVYNVLVLYQIKQHNIRIQQHFSSLEKINLKWLYRLTLLCILFLIIYILFNRSQLLIVGHFDANALIPSIPWIFLVIVVYAIGLAALFQPTLIHDVTAIVESTQSAPENLPLLDRTDKTLKSVSTDSNMCSAQTEEDTRYTRTKLSLQNAEKYKMLIMQKMQEDELYLNGEFSLIELAKKTELPAHQVSQVINSQMDQNFFSFVNSYRIQRAKELLSDDDSQSIPITDLAMKVGFKSKSAFYDAFKKATQMTPTQFKKSLKDLN